MSDGKVPVDLKFINSARALVPRIEKVISSSVYKFPRPSISHVNSFYQAATKLMSLSNLNRTVHLPTYNKLIGEEALNLNADLKKIGSVNAEEALTLNADIKKVEESVNVGLRKAEGSENADLRMKGKGTNTTDVSMKEKNDVT